MQSDQLRNVHRAKPFQPFRLHLVDGRTFDVPHREFLSQSPRGRTVVVYHTESPDTCSILDLALVTEIEIAMS